MAIGMTVSFFQSTADVLDPGQQKRGKKETNATCAGKTEERRMRERMRETGLMGERGTGGGWFH